MKSRLETLSTVGSVSVVRSSPNNQNGYTWEIEFISDVNNGNIIELISYGGGLSSTNEVGGATVQVVHERHGSQIGGSFQIEFGK